MFHGVKQIIKRQHHQKKRDASRFFNKSILGLLDFIFFYYDQTWFWLL